ncbi:S8 family serine peptidase [Photobacterium sp. MCCC 1A19761]|uniref:S8 family serine peptidase n=1 Tax=Photobacterium sp. MCCC 1A19761 TaxID=3115000 RepID=UPI00307D7636
MLKPVFKKSIHLRSSLYLFSLLTPFTTLAEPNFRPGQILVQASPDELGQEKVLRFYPNAKVSLVEVEPGQESGKLNAYRAQGKKASKNFIATHFATEADYSSYQWHFERIQAADAWGLTSGVGETVAVLDTGLRLGGPDGIGCVSIQQGADIVNGDSDPTDGDGHGTHVSGTIAQTSGNYGVDGLAYGSCVMPVKVLSDSGSGSFADISDGIYFAVNNGAKVINMSLGVSARYGMTNDPLMDAALDYAADHGVIVVAAAGNDGFRKNVSYPAIYPSVIAVGATDINDDVASYSNRGKGLDLVAPGGTTNTDFNNDGYGDGVLQETFDGTGQWGYFFFQGTSMATPHVSALAAMLLAKGIPAAQVKEALIATAKDLGDPGFDKNYGYGLIQAYSALNWVPDNTTPGGGGDNSNTCVDADGDGYCAAEFGGDDCNDADPNVNPGKNERGPRSRDGIDNNCDGIIDNN